MVQAVTNELQRKWPARLPELAFIGAIIGQIAVGLPFILSAKVLGSQVRRDDVRQFSPFTFGLLIIAHVLMCAFIILWTKRVDALSIQSLRLHKPPAKIIIVGAVAGIIVTGGNVFWQVFGKHSGIERTPIAMSLPSLIGWSVATLGLMIPLNSMAEELLCRGYGLARLGERRGEFYASVITSVAFATMHFLLERPGLGRLLTLIAAGLFFCVLLIRTGSLWAPIAAHTTWNWCHALVSGNAQQGGLFRYTFSTDHPLDRPVLFALIVLSTSFIWFATSKRMIQTQ